MTRTEKPQFDAEALLFEGVDLRLLSDEELEAVLTLIDTIRGERE
jgi:hypothetical protein